MFLFLFWIFFGASIMVSLGIGLLASLGLLWLPFGALIYAKEGRKNGHTIRYALSGAACSLLFYIPWLFVHKSIRNQPIPRRNVTLAYLFLYIAWLLGPIGFLGIPALFFGVDFTRFGIVHIWTGISLAFLIATFLLIVRAREQSVMSAWPLPRLPYLLPLIGLYITSAPYGMLLLWDALEMGWSPPF